MITVTFFRIMQIEIRRHIGLLLFPLFVLLAGSIALEEYPEGIALWTKASVAIQYTILLLGPLAAGMAAFVAGRERQRNTRELLLTTPTPALLRTLIPWLATLFWIALAYGVVTLFISALTAQKATWGGPNLGPIVQGLLAIMAESALGYLLGTYLPSRLTAPLVAITFYLGLGILSNQNYAPFAYLSPLEVSAGSVFYGYWSQQLWAQFIWLGGLTGLALTGLALYWERAPSTWVAFVITLLMTMGGASLLLKPRQDRTRSLIPYEPICQEAAIPVCVHPAYTVLLPETTAIINAISKPLVGLPTAPIRASQQPMGVDLRPDGTVTFYLYDQTSLERLLPWNTTLAIINGEGDAQQVIQNWLLYQAGFNPEPYFELFTDDPEGVAAAFDRFKNLTSSQQQAWLAANLDKLQNDQITLEDLP